MIAHLVATHGNEALETWVRGLIENGTPKSPEKREALALLKPTTVLPKMTVDWSSYCVRVAPELGRLSIVLKCANLFRLWAIARDLSKSTDQEGRVISSGKCPRIALRAHVKAIGIGYSPEHLNRLLRAGEGRFWNCSRTHLYTRSPRYVATWMAEEATLAAPAAIATNQPGHRDIWLSPLGSLEQWKATLYAGWHTHRENPTIARETLAMLFGRTPQTLRNWEQKHLHAVLPPVLITPKPFWKMNGFIQPFQTIPKAMSPSVGKSV